MGTTVMTGIFFANGDALDSNLVNEDGYLLDPDAVANPLALGREKLFLTDDGKKVEIDFIGQEYLNYVLLGAGLVLGFVCLIILINAQLKNQGARKRYHVIGGLSVLAVLTSGSTVIFADCALEAYEDGVLNITENGLMLGSMAGIAVCLGLFFFLACKTMTPKRR